MSDMDLLRRCLAFKKLADAVCSKCGDRNPYLDNDDPNFVCRQCRTRQQAWGGDDKQQPVAQEKPSQSSPSNDIKDKVFHALSALFIQSGFVSSKHDIIEYRKVPAPVHNSHDEFKWEFKIDPTKFAGREHFLWDNGRVLIRQILGHSTFMEPQNLKVVWDIGGDPDAGAKNATRVVWRKMYVPVGEMSFVLIIICPETP